MGQLRKVSQTCNGNSGRKRRERRDKKGTEEIFETIKAENFPKFMSDTKQHIQQTQNITPLPKKTPCLGISL